MLPNVLYFVLYCELALKLLVATITKVPLNIDNIYAR